VHRLVSSFWRKTHTEDDDDGHRKVAEALRSRFALAAMLLEDAAEDILAYRPPLEHQRQLHSTNTLERLNKEIKAGRMSSASFRIRPR
jgi:putative transposase